MARLCLALVAAFWLFAALLARTRRSIAGMRAVLACSATGDLNRRVDVASRDELGALGGELNRTLDEQLLRRCNAMVEFFEAGQQIELLLQRKFEPADFTARVAEARARLPKLVAELPADAIAAINATIDQFALSDGELRSAKTIRDSFYRRMSNTANVVDAMFVTLFPLCPDLMGDEPPRMTHERGQEEGQT